MSTSATATRRWPQRWTSGGTSTCSFFFSSRRRHTRFDCDWSSDVCSSDLISFRHPSKGKPHCPGRRSALRKYAFPLATFPQEESADCVGPWQVQSNRYLRRQKDRKSTRLNSSHSQISYAVFCLKKKKTIISGVDVLCIFSH